MTWTRQLAFPASFLITFASAAVTRSQNVQQGSLPAALKLVATATSSNGGAPNFGVHSGDSRFMYVGEQNGRVRILDFSQPNPLLPTDFLSVEGVLGATLVDDTGTGERGLLGAAFHPEFNNPANPNGFRKFYTFTSETFASATPHFFHQSETPTYNHQSVIREWTAADPNPQGVSVINTRVSSRVVMRIAKPGPFHNGGSLVFGPDDYMYVSLGDGGGGNANGANDGGNDVNANQGHTNPGNPDTDGGWMGQGNAQDRRNVYGDILRIKPTLDEDPNTKPNTVGGGYRVPIDNPFTAESNAISPVPGWRENWVDEIYAYGFRNPFRISFDSADPTKLYAADVGQDRNTISREEVSLISKGGNYGWVIKSGTEINDRPPGAPTNTYSPNIGVPLIDPVAQYPTTQLGHGGLAAIGGFVYRGDDLPWLQGKYIFGDLNRGDGTGGRLMYTDFSDPALSVFDLKIVGGVQKPDGAFIHGVAEDANYELYFLFGNGQIMKLVAPEPSTWVLATFLAVLIGVQSRRR
jgi:glucose/arabinose dehydrogenase